MHAVVAGLISCAAWLFIVGGALVVFNCILPPSESLPAVAFAARVEQELRNPDPDVRAALREVDDIGWSAPAVAIEEPKAPTTVAAGMDRAARIAPHPAANAGWQMGAEQQMLAMNANRPSAQVAQAQALSGYHRVIDPSGYGAIGALLMEQMNPPPRSVIDSRPWFWPYVSTDLGHDRYLLHERFGGGRVSREWLELHRHDIMQAVRKGNFEC